MPEPLTTSTAELPQHLQNVLASAPANVDRRTGADLVTRHMFPVSYRSLEVWPLPTRYVNGKAVVPTAALFELAYAKLSAAPVITRHQSAPRREKMPAVFREASKPSAAKEEKRRAALLSAEQAA